MTPRYKQKLLTSALATAGIVGTSMAVVPQLSYAQYVLEEVVVTARKREESLQDTPIAVSAFGSDMLREAKIENIGDLTHNVPGLTRQEGSKSANFSIRGIGTRLNQVTGEPGVGIYVDSIYIPRNDTQLVDVIEMESVQVLRGPQGTLFGKNTVGGAVLLTTKKPTEEVEGFARAEFGDLDRQNYSFGVSGPLIGDSFLGGIQIDTRKQDGYRDDPFTGRDYGNVDRQSALAQLRYQSDAFTGDLMLFYGEVDENAAPHNCQWIDSTVLQSFTSPGQAAPYQTLCNRSEALADDEEVAMDRAPLVYEVTNQLAGLSLAWDLEDVTVKSITGYLYQDDVDVFSQDPDGTDLFTINNSAEFRRQLNGNGIDAEDETRKFFSQEFQLIGDAFDDFVEYTVGIYYSNEKIEDNPGGNILGPGGWLGSDLGNGQVSLLPSSISFREAVIRDFENTSAAAFGQAILSLSDMWQLTLGARYTYEEKEASQENYVSASVIASPLSRDQFDALENYIHEVVPDTQAPNVKGKEDWDEFNPAATLTMFTPDSWQGEVFDGGMLYLSANNGFKAGGFSPFGDEFLPFDPEEVWTYEFGYKLDLWESRVRVNGAIYHSTYDDIQINVTRTFPSEDPDGIDQTENGIANAGEATITGAELEVNAMPIEGLLLSASASYTDAEYDEFEDLDPQPDGAQITIDRSNEEFAFIPEWTWTVAAQYDWDLGLGTISPRISGSYVDEVFIGLDPVSAQTPEATLDSYTLWNLRVAFRPAAVEGLEVAGYVNNLTDEEYFGTGIASVEGIGALSLIPGKQQTYGVEFHYYW